MTSYRNVPTISYEMASRIVAVGIAVAEREGVRGVVTVVDPALGPVAFGRADGATPHSVETSRRKALTAASTRKPTSAMDSQLAVALEHGSGGILTSINGGVPIRFDGFHVGGLGIAGGHPDVDAKIAILVLREVGADRIE